MRLKSKFKAFTPSERHRGLTSARCTAHVREVNPQAPSNAIINFDGIPMNRLKEH